MVGWEIEPHKMTKFYDLPNLIPTIMRHINKAKNFQQFKVVKIYNGTFAQFPLREEPIYWF